MPPGTTGLPNSTVHPGHVRLSVGDVMSENYDVIFEGPLQSCVEKERNASGILGIEPAGDTGSKPTTESRPDTLIESSGSTDQYSPLQNSVRGDLSRSPGHSTSHHELTQEEVLLRMDVLAGLIEDGATSALLARYIRLYRTRRHYLFTKLGQALGHLRVGLPPSQEQVQGPLGELAYALESGEPDDIERATWAVGRLSLPSEKDKVYTEEDLQSAREKGYNEGRYENLERNRVARHRRVPPRPMKID